MTTSASPRRVQGRSARPTDITLDAEFQHLLPSLLPEERTQLEERLHRNGCREPLLVWPHHGRLLLLLDYEAFAVIRLYRIPFRVLDMSFPDRDDARMFIIKEALARHSLSKLWVNYLRGLRYAGEKDTHGGDRRSVEVASPFQRLKSAEALAEMLGTSPRTIRRDGEFAGAVNRIVAGYGPQARDLLLNPQSRLCREGIQELDRRPLEEQKDLLNGLVLRQRPPKSWRTHGQSATLTLPLEMDARAEAHLRRRGPEESVTLARKLLELVARVGEKSEASPENVFRYVDGNADQNEPSVCTG